MGVFFAILAVLVALLILEFVPEGLGGQARACGSVERDGGGDTEGRRDVRWGEEHAERVVMVDDGQADVDSGHEAIDRFCTALSHVRHALCTRCPPPLLRLHRPPLPHLGERDRPRAPQGGKGARTLHVRLHKSLFSS